ncbi:MAG: multiple sugar transport system ATP-binding protein [Verrucomicrobiota bacterium]|jgi:multiple sugar transport system ATP-binding protein
MSAVTLKNIGGADLAIRDREFVVLTGPVGCGSSALIRMIAGLAEISKGDLLFDERRINDVPSKDRDVALLAHDYTPYPGMTVSENLAIGLQRRKFASGEIKKRVTAVAETLGLQDQLSAKPESLSPEQQRYVGLARAMVRQPKVYLFDEPLADLNPAAASRGRAAIAALRLRVSSTILYATSDPVEALAFGARIVIFEKGVAQQDADAQAIFDEPANLFVAKFFGDPPMNLVHGTLKQERDAVVFSETGDGTIAIRWPTSRFVGGKAPVGGPAVLGFRPQAVEIAGAAGEVDRSSNTFQALVDRAEPKGEETDLYLRTGTHDLICRSRRWAGQAEAGHRFQFEIELEKTHLFDAVSGGRIMAES